MAEWESMVDGARVTTVLNYACKNGVGGRIVQMIVGICLWSALDNLVCHADPNFLHNTTLIGHSF